MLRKRRESCDLAGGFFEQVVNQGLVGFGLFRGHATELAQQLWGNADCYELFGVAGGWASDAAGAAQFRIGGFRDVGEVEAAIRNIRCVPCASPGAR